MKSKRFEGKDDFDLESQIFSWQALNPTIVIKKRYKIEKLPIGPSEPRKKFSTILIENFVAIRVDYED